MLVFMGFMHQGGVVPSLISFQMHAPPAGNTNHLIYYHTYMPPKHLLALPKSQSNVPFVLHDLKGAELGELRKSILRILEAVSYDPSKQKIFLVTPATVDLHGLLNATAANGIDGHFEPAQRHWPHMSMEDSPAKFDHWFSRLSLEVYLYHPKA